MQADKDSYAAALTQDRKPSVGRLLGDEYLLPLPYNGATWAATWDKDLKVNVVDGEYDFADQRNRFLIALRGFGTVSPEGDAGRRSGFLIAQRGFGTADS